MKTRLKKVPVASLERHQACFIPADSLAVEQLNEAKIAVGSVVSANITKPRSVAMNRKAHAFGKLIAENVESFEGLDAHSAFKRMQLESGIECEMLVLDLGGLKVPYKIPRSIAFDKMDEQRFDALLYECARFVARQYFSDSTPEEVLKMIEELLDG